MPTFQLRWVGDRLVRGRRERAVGEDVDLGAWVGADQRTRRPDGLAEPGREVPGLRLAEGGQGTLAVAPARGGRAAGAGGRGGGGGGWGGGAGGGGGAEKTPRPPRGRAARAPRGAGPPPATRAGGS